MSDEEGLTIVEEVEEEEEEEEDVQEEVEEEKEDMKAEVIDNKKVPAVVSENPEPATASLPSVAKAELVAQFGLFSKFGDKTADGKTIKLSQSDKWFRQVEQQMWSRAKKTHLNVSR